MSNNKAIMPEEIGLPTDVASAMDVLQEFCKKRIVGCATCPLFAGMSEEIGGCIYQNFVPAEVSVNKIIDMNSYNMSGESSGLPAKGSVVSIGGCNFIVLDYIGNCVAVITEDSIRNMRFGDSADYKTSKVREYLNGDFYRNLAKRVGEDNIVKHRIDITPEDGKTETKFVEDFVSVMSVDSYRKYSCFITNPGWWWLANAKSESETSGYAREVCTVNMDGILGNHECEESAGYVRAFCILKSCVLNSHS